MKRSVLGIVVAVGCTGGGTGSADHLSTGEDSSSSSSTGPSSGGGETMDTTGTLTGVSTEGPTGPECTDNEGCSGAAGFCNEAGECVACDAMVEPDEACAGESAVRPVCEGGVCVQCTTVGASACAGQTPVCGAGNECRGCGEHGECAESACHLDGGQVGACFEETDVVTANSTAELEAAFAGAGTNDNVVVVLTGGNYSGVAIDLLANAEVAVLGDGTVDIVGNRLGGIIGSGGDGIISQLTLRHGVTRREAGRPGYVGLATILAGLIPVSLAGPTSITRQPVPRAGGPYWRLP